MADEHQPEVRLVTIALERAGFVVDRIVGSHHIMTVPGDTGRTVTVPFTGTRTSNPGRCAIIPQSGLTPERFAELL